MARYHERASGSGWHLIDPVGPAVRGADPYVAITIGRWISKYHDRSERGCGCGKGRATFDRSCPRISPGISPRRPLAYFTTDFLRYPPVKILSRAFLAFSEDRAAAAAQGWLANRLSRMLPQRFLEYCTASADARLSRIPLGGRVLLRGPPTDGVGGFFFVLAVLLTSLLAYYRNRIEMPARGDAR